MVELLQIIMNPYYYKKKKRKENIYNDVLRIGIWEERGGEL